MKSLGENELGAKNKKILFSLVFASNVLALCYVKKNSAKRVMKLYAARFLNELFFN